MSDREIALDTLRELAGDGTESGEVRLEAARQLLMADEPDFLQEAATAVLEMEERIAAVEQAVGKRRLSRAKAKT